MLSDFRTNTDVPFYAVATDTGMSGWGKAPSRSIVALACRDREELHRALDVLDRRQGMTRVRVVTRILANGMPHLTRRAGDHLALYDAADWR